MSHNSKFSNSVAALIIIAATAYAPTTAEAKAPLWKCTMWGGAIGALSALCISGNLTSCVALAPFVEKYIDGGC